MPDNDRTTRPRTARRLGRTDLLWVTYTAAWCVGLLLLPSGPSAGAGDEAVAAHYRSHAVRVATQALLVHAVAGACLAVLAVLVWRAARRDHHALGVAALLAGVGAAVVSLLQAAIAVAAVADAGASPARDLAAAFHAVNRADVAKLVLLAGFVAATTRWCGRRTVTVLGVPLVVLLPLGAAAFLRPAPLLQVALTVSLPLLLGWFVAATRAVGSAATTGSPAAPGSHDTEPSAHPTEAAATGW